MRVLLISILLTALLISLCPAKSVELSSAQIYRSNGDYLKALEFYRLAAADYENKITELKAQYPDPKDFEKKATGDMKNLTIAYYEMGDCLKQLGEYQEMNQCFTNSLKYGDKFVNEILDIRDELWVKFYNDGVPIFNEQKYEQSLEFFEKAVMIDPTRIDGFRERGNCYLQLAQTESDSMKKADLLQKAAADFDKVIANDPKGEELIVRINKANMYYKMGNYNKAIPAYQDVLKFDPENLGAISQLAMIYQEQGEEEKAVEMYNKVLKTKASDPDLWFNLGILYFNMGKFTEARSAFDQVLKINPNDLETLMNLVSALWNAQMQAEAIPYLEHIVQIDPQYTEAWKFLWAAYGKMAEREGITDKERNEYIKKVKDAYDHYKALTGGK